MSKTAFLFPGQASQFPGMGKDMYESDPKARGYFDRANEILGLNITDVMFHGSEEALKQTHITQPSVFLHSIIKMFTSPYGPKPDAVAGHSLGEFSALVAAGVLSFEDGLRLVQIRANAMHAACQQNPGTMAAIVGLEDELIERLCASVTDDIVIPANYNCPGQLVISGSLSGIKKAESVMMAAGAKKFIVIPVGGAFHSPLMEPARDQLAAAIERTTFNDAQCPVYQNTDGLAHILASEIKQNLIAQLTSPVLWTQIMQNMIADSFTQFFEVGGNGTVLSGFLKRIDRNLPITAL